MKHICLINTEHGNKIYVEPVGFRAIDLTFTYLESLVEVSRKVTLNYQDAADLSNALLEMMETRGYK